ncbi:MULTISPECIES: hypothetical protein [Acinetobacter]|uniref:Uncharacterized protein n=1 Tax=Acinetobacter kyonggiensis TaxID=595670 RepID=A0A1H3JWC9_9GAMM|nr:MULTISPECIES: hypothetical protein [Acinetobacter]OTG98750.1 hypothetical protein B9T30_11885 [Acinetobacter sp. ANC 4973]SDY43658.1 hypothetical protein SAMN05421643_11074 [Acinetobacter kyonggiensis]
MPNELLSVIQKKQAIERGLSDYMNATVLERVLNYWEQEYGDQPSFVLNRFLSEICNTDELRFYRKEMLRKVLSEMSAVEKQVLLEIKPKLEPEELISIDIADAFFGLVDAVTLTVTATDLNDFNDEVKQQLQDMGLAIETSVKINDAAFIEVLPLTLYAQVITIIYECYCEFYGPAKADQVYARAKMQIKTKYPDVDLHQLL